MGTQKASRPKNDIRPEPAAKRPPGENRLVGTWSRVEPERTSAPYPEGIEFKARGVYFARKGERQSFSLWDSGGYSILGSGRIRISTASDAEIVYRFSISGDRLTIWTEEGALVYERIS